MSPSEIEFWKRAAADLEIEVAAPFTATFQDGVEMKASALVRNFGAKNGMVVDADYANIEPYTKALRDGGYGFSANIGGQPQDYDRGSMIEILRDWGWSGEISAKPSWL